MEPGHALITGGGIAGPAIAFWLNRYGWQTTLVERAEAFRTGGQNVDIRGAAREVMRRMGLEDAALRRNTGELGTQFVDRSGRVLAQFNAPRPGENDGPTAEMEILRGELSQLLLKQIDGHTTLVSGDHISALTDRGDGCEVYFEHGRDTVFDLVIVAEGTRSSTRELAFGRAQSPLTPVGLYMAWLGIPHQPHDTDWWRWFNAPGRRVATLRPGQTRADTPGDTKATLSFISDIPGLEQLEQHAQKQLLREIFADAGWETPRILDALDETSWFLERLSQVHMKRWASGRVVLLGDSAWAPTPIAGKGTSSALIGAFVLAQQIADNSDHTQAFRRYERMLHDYIRKTQRLPPGAPRLAHPKTSVGIDIMTTVARAVASAPVQKLRTVGSQMLPSTPDFRLPDN